MFAGLAHARPRRGFETRGDLDGQADVIGDVVWVAKGTLGQLFVRTALEMVVDGTGSWAKTANRNERASAIMASPLRVVSDPTHPSLVLGFNTRVLRRLTVVALV